MGSQKIDIRKLAPIGISNVDVYNNGEKLSDNDIPKNATKVKLRIGVFFDGTLNNGFNSEAVYYKQERPFKNPNDLKIKYRGFDVATDSSFFNSYTNVKLLFDIYETKFIPPINKEKAPYYYYQTSVYIEGIGTLRDEEDDTLGTAFGEGDRGVIARVEQACGKVTNQIKIEFDKLNSTYKNQFYIDSIQFDVFGFSRGAAAARHFCNEVLKQKEVFSSIKDKVEKLPVSKNPRNRDVFLVATDKTAVSSPQTRNLKILKGKEFTGGKLGETLKAKKINYPKTKVSVEFLGLFDTVISQMLEKYRIIDFARENASSTMLQSLSPTLGFLGALGLKNVGQIQKVNPDVSHPNIKRVFHLVAADEWRENFSLTPISNQKYGNSLRVLGAHSDVGGGYADIAFEINNLHFFDMPLNSSASDMESAIRFKNDLRQWYINNQYCKDDLESIFWQTMHHVRVFKILSNSPITGPIYNDLFFETALKEESFLQNETEKIIGNKFYKLVGYHYILKSKRKLNCKLSLVYFNVMKHMAITFANVPFTLPLKSTLQKKEYEFDKNYDLTNKSNSGISYQDLMIKVAEHGWAKSGQKAIDHKELFSKEGDTLTYKVPAELYTYIKQNFVHLSAHFNSVSYSP